MDRRDCNGRLLVLEGLRDFQEHLGGRLTVTLPEGIGRKVEVHEMDEETIEASIAGLRRRART
jgi:3-dehydroquinate synthase